MGWIPVIRLAVSHDYFQPEAPRLQLLPPPGCLIRGWNGQFTVFAPEGAAPQGTITLMLQRPSLDFCRVTSGYDWTQLPVFHLPQGQDRVVFGKDAPDRTEPRPPGDQRLLRLEIDAADEAPRNVALDFEAVSAHWAYHLSGRGLRDDMRIVDGAAAVHFDDLGIWALPNGMPARTLRSAEPLALRARPQRHFSLQHDGPFGPVTLVPVLPAAGVETRPIPDDGTAGRLQADIYVTLS